MQQEIKYKYRAVIKKNFISLNLAKIANFKLKNLK